MTPRGWSAPWLMEGLVPGLLVLMAAGFAWALGELAVAWLPSWSLALTVFVAVVAALTASAGVSLFRRKPRFMSDRWQWWVVQVAGIAVIARLGSLIQQPWPALLEELAAWPRDPGLIVDPQTLFNVVTGLAVVFSVHATLIDLHDLAESDWVTLTDSPRDKLQARFFGGGLLVMVLAGLARVGPFALLDLGRPTVGGVVLPTLIYFMAGLALLALIQYVGRAAVWSREGAEMQIDLGPRWARHSLSLIGLAALLAAVLPTSQGEGLLGIGRWLAIGLIYLMNGVITLVGLLLVGIASLLSWLFPWLRLPTGPSASPREPPRPPPMDPALALGDLWPFIFWTLVTVMVALVVWSYLREQRELWPRLRGSRLWRGVRRWWDHLWRRGERWADQARRGLARLLERVRPPAGLPPVPFWSLRRASTREQVLYYYLSTLKRAGRQGFGRRPAQTPDEYAPNLEAHLPDAADEANALTQAFDAIRYAGRPIDTDQARRLRAAWERVRAALQRRAPRGR